MSDSPIQLSMVADLCHFVLSCFRGEKAKRRHAKTRQMVTVSCFRMATFRPATRKREKAPRENPPNGDFSCFRMATFRPATRKYATFHALRFRLLFVVSLPGGAKGRYAKTRRIVSLAFSPRNHAYTSWHKSATIVKPVILHRKY